MKTQNDIARKKNIRICFVAATAYPLFKKMEGTAFGGAELNLYLLARKFAEKDDYRVSFMVGDYGQPKKELFDGVEVIRMDRLNYDPGYLKGKGPLNGILKEIGLFRIFLASDSDIYVNTCAGGLLGRLVAAVKVCRGRRVVFRMANDIDADLMFFWNIKQYMTNCLYKFGLKNADAVISQTEIQRKLLLENAGIDSTVIRNGHEIIRYGNGAVRRTILWIARAEGMKRPELFIEMAGRLPEMDFVMIMPGENELKRTIKEKARMLDNLEFIDYVPPDAVMQYFRDAKVFVNTSDNEGFPNTFIQACMAGTPLLSLRVDPDDIIKRYGLGCCCNGDIEKAIEFLRAVPDDKLSEYGQNAIGYVAGNHDIKITLKEYDMLFRKLVGAQAVGST